MQTPREACEMHYVKWKKKNDGKKLKRLCHAVKSVTFISSFFSFFQIFLYLSLTFCLLWSRGYDVASYGSPTVVLHCSLVFLGVGGKDRNCIDSPPHSTPPLPILLPLPSLLSPPPCPGGAVVILTCSFTPQAPVGHTPSVAESS